MTTEAMRESWRSRMGFLLAAVGSAVGLGNMWRFSYLTAEYGGAAFLVLYLLLVVAVGIPVLLAELAIGRGARKSPMLALEHFGGARWVPLGLFFVAVGFVILSYYNVIAGWAARYAFDALFTGVAADAGPRFAEISEGWDAVGWHVLFMALTAGIVAFGIQGGIERSVRVLMPTLFVLLIGLAVYAWLLPGAGRGYDFYLRPDFAKLFSLDVLNAAAGQAFFSLSLGMGAIMTYASYLTSRDHLPNESLFIASADFGVAFFAGLVVFPLLFALGMQAQIAEGTVGALFIVLPGAFSAMELGRVVAIVFFVALGVAALTSTISVLEVVVATVVDRFEWKRPRAALLVGGLLAVTGIPAALDTDVLGTLDTFAANYCLLAGGLALSIFVGWFMDDPAGEVSHGAERVRWFPIWVWLLRIPVPAVLAFLLLMQLLG